MNSMPLPATSHHSMAQRQQRELQLVQDLQQELKAVQELGNHSTRSCVEQVPPHQIEQWTKVNTQAPIQIPTHVRVVNDGSLPLEECTDEMELQKGLSTLQEVRFKPQLLMDCVGPTMVLHTTQNHPISYSAVLAIYRYLHILCSHQPCHIPAWHSANNGN